MFYLAIFFSIFLYLYLYFFKESFEEPLCVVYIPIFVMLSPDQQLFM